MCSLEEAGFEVRDDGGIEGMDCGFADLVWICVRGCGEVWVCEGCWVCLEADCHDEFDATHWVISFLSGGQWLEPGFTLRRRWDHGGVALVALVWMDVGRNGTGNVAIRGAGIGGLRLCKGWGMRYF